MCSKRLYTSKLSSKLNTLCFQIVIWGLFIIICYLMIQIILFISNHFSNTNYEKLQLSSFQLSIELVLALIKKCTYLRCIKIPYLLFIIITIFILHHFLRVCHETHPYFITLSLKARHLYLSGTHKTIRFATYT